MWEKISEKGLKNYLLRIKIGQKWDGQNSCQNPPKPSRALRLSGYNSESIPLIASESPKALTGIKTTAKAASIRSIPRLSESPKALTGIKTLRCISGKLG